MDYSGTPFDNGYPAYFTDLHVAIQLRRIAVVKRLLEEGALKKITNSLSASTDPTPLHVAASLSGTRNIIRLLREYGADPNARDISRNTPLIWCLMSKDNNASLNLTALLEPFTMPDGTRIMGANPNFFNELSYTPLHVAASKNDALSIKVLLIHNASTNTLNAQNELPLDLATTEDAINLLR